MRKRQAVVALITCLAVCHCISAQVSQDSLALNPALTAAKTTGFKCNNHKRTYKTESAPNETETTAANSAATALIDVPEKYFTKLRLKVQRLNRKVTKSTSHYLDKLIANEQRLRASLQKTDSSAAQELFGQSVDSLQRLKQQLLSGASFSPSSDIAKDYNAYLDTLGGSLGFLNNAKGLLKNRTAITDKLTASNIELTELKNKLAITDGISQYVQERKDILTGYFSADKLNALRMPGMEQISKNIFLYRQQLIEWKEAFSQPGKLEAKTMGVLRQLPLFKQFMLEHGELAGLLDAPEGYGASTAGLQTRDDIMQLVTQRFGNDAGNMQQMINGQLSAAREQLQQLKNRFPQLSATAEMPDYKGAENKSSKTFLQRIQYSSTLGFSPHNTLLPTSAEMGAQAGYKFSKKGLAGLGASFKAGLGRDIQHTRFSNEGFGLRSFIDWQLAKAKLHLNGGIEYNYLMALANADVQQSTITINSPWQTAALLGISKQFKIGKQTNKQVMLLYDFLHARHYPVTEAVKLRVAYSL